MKTSMKRSERYAIKKSAKWKTAGSVLVSSLVLGGALIVGNSSVSAEETSTQVEVQTSDTFTTDSSSQSDELVTYQAPIQYVEEAARVNPSSEVSAEVVAETRTVEAETESAASSKVTVDSHSTNQATVAEMATSPVSETVQKQHESDQETAASVVPRALALSADTTSTLEASAAEETTTTSAEDVSILLSTTDLTKVESDATISFDGSNVVTDAVEGVTVTDSTVTISKAGTYTLTGNGSSYTVVVADGITDPIVLILDGLNLRDSQISSETGSEVLINVLSDSSIASTSSNAIEAAGTVTVTSVTNSTLTLSSSTMNALKADSFVIDSVQVDLNSATEAGILATTTGVIHNATVTVTAGDDGIVLEYDTDYNSGDLTITDSKVTIQAGQKGIAASDQLTVDGDTQLTVVAGDEGLEARYLELLGGTIDITAGDDGLNAQEWTDTVYATMSNNLPSSDDLKNSTLILIDGANITIVADGDGIDSNGDVTVKSGNVYVTQTSQDNAAIDYDGTGIISGGTVWAIGNQGMAQAFMTGSSQSYITANVSGSTGDTITVTDSEGKVIASTTATTSFGNVVFSTEALESNQTYTITTSSGSTVTATATMEGSNNGPGGMGPGGFPGGGMTPPDFPGGNTNNGRPPFPDNGAGMTPPDLPGGSDNSGRPSFPGNGDGSTPPSKPEAGGETVAPSLPEETTDSNESTSGQEGTQTPDVPEKPETTPVVDGSEAGETQTPSENGNGSSENNTELPNRPTSPETGQDTGSESKSQNGNPSSVESNSEKGTVKSELSASLTQKAKKTTQSVSTKGSGLKTGSGKSGSSQTSSPNTLPSTGQKSQVGLSIAGGFLSLAAFAALRKKTYMSKK